MAGDLRLPLCGLRCPMRFQGRGGEEIVSLEDWLKFGGPASEKHWVDGRSAKCLAEAWLGDAGEELAALLATAPGGRLDGFAPTVGIAEAQLTKSEAEMGDAAGLVAAICMTPAAGRAPWLMTGPQQDARQRPVSLTGGTGRRSRCRAGPGRDGTQDAGAPGVAGTTFALVAMFGGAIESPSRLTNSPVAAPANPPRPRTARITVSHGSAGHGVSR